MSFALLTHAAAGSGGAGDVTTSAIDTTGAGVIVAVISSYNVSINPPVIIDSKVNVWVKLTSLSSGIFFTTLYLTTGSTLSVGSGHTFSTLGAQFCGLAVASFSASAGYPALNVSGGATGSGVTSKQPGSLTPTYANSLIVTGLGFDTVNTLAIDSSFAISDQVNYLGGNHAGAGLAYLIQGAASAVNPTWSWSSAMAVSAPMMVIAELQTTPTNVAGGSYGFA